MTDHPAVAEMRGLRIQLDTMTALSQARERQFARCRQQRAALLAALTALRGHIENGDLSETDVDVWCAKANAAINNAIATGAE